MEFRDTIVILRLGKLRESDLWIRFLSPKLGVASAFAFGGCCSRHRFPGCLDILNEIEVRVKSSRDGKYLNFEEGTLLNGPRRLRNDWRRLGVAVNCFKFVEAFGIGEDGAAKAHFLVKKMLQVLEESLEVSDYFPLFFRFRIVADQGYAPVFDLCQKCGRPIAGRVLFFQIPSGGIRCPECVDENFCFRINQDALACLQSISKEEPAMWPLRFLNTAAKEQCANIVDNFIRYHTGLVWEKGCFRRTQ